MNHHDFSMSNSNQANQEYLEVVSDYVAIGNSSIGLDKSKTGQNLAAFFFSTSFDVYSV